MDHHIQSYLLKPGDVVSTKEKSKTMKVVEENITRGSGIGVPAYFDVDPAKRRIIMKVLPSDSLYKDTFTIY